MKSRKLLFLSLTLVASIASAQKRADVKVVQVNDRRSSSFAQLTVALDLPGIKSSDVEASRVIIRTASDDTGQVLIPQEAPKLETNSSRGRRSDPTAALTTILVLNSPQRSATQIPEIAGDIELYMPSKDSNSMAVIPKFMAQSGKALSNRALKANGVEISLISKSQLEAIKKQEAAKKRGEYASQGYEGESLEQAITSFLESFFAPQANDVLISLKDPNDRIHEISYVDASGEPRRVMRREENGMTILSTWEAAPGPDTSLRVALKTPKAMVRQSFSVKNVALP